MQEGAYKVQALGTADDAAPADGRGVLDYAQARAHALELLAQSEGEAPGPMTVRRCFALYVEHRQALGKPTADIERRAAATFLQDLGDVLVEALTTERLEKWLRDYVATGAITRTRAGAEWNRKKPPSTEETLRKRRSSANRLYNILRAALNHAFKRGKVKSDLAWRRVEKFKSVEKARKEYLSVAEAQRLLNACDPDFRLLVRGALETGCRYSELIRLAVGDFDADVGTVFIRKSKSGKPRHVVLSPEGAQFFTSLCVGRAGDEILFRHDDGRPWQSNWQGERMDAAVERAKIPRVTFHALRHTYASLHVMGGTPMMVIAQNLGHANIKMLEQTYMHLAPSFMKDAIAAGAPRYNEVGNSKVVALR